LPWSRTGMTFAIRATEPDQIRDYPALADPTPRGGRLQTPRALFNVLCPPREKQALRSPRAMVAGGSPGPEQPTNHDQADRRRGALSFISAASPCSLGEESTSSANSWEGNIVADPATSCLNRRRSEHRLVDTRLDVSGFGWEAQCAIGVS